jgi:hypothetical protein
MEESTHPALIAPNLAPIFLPRIALQEDSHTTADAPRCE